METDTEVFGTVKHIGIFHTFLKGCAPWHAHWTAHSTHTKPDF